MPRFPGFTACCSAAVLLGLSVGQIQPARSQTTETQIGTLACDLSGGVGLIVTSSQTMTCQFQSATGRAEVYTGSVRRFGLDIGVVSSARMVWNVVAPVRRAMPGALAGTYVGVSAEGAVAVGAGAKLLVGGSGNTFSLQPLSLQTQGGLNIAAGVSEMVLTAAN